MNLHGNGREENSDHRKEATESERDEGSKRSTHGRGDRLFFDAVAHAGVSVERVVRAHAFGGFARKVFGDPGLLERGREGGEFTFRVRGEALPLTLEERTFGVSLRRNGHVLAHRHRERAGTERGGARDRESAEGRGCGGDTNDHAGDGHDAIICAEYAGTQAVEVRR